MEMLTKKHRVHVKLDDLQLVFSPLSYKHFLEIQECTKMVAGEPVTDTASAIFKYVKFGVRDVKGIKLYGGKSYKCEHDEDGFLTDDCVEDIIMMPIREKLIVAVTKIMAGEIDKLEGDVEVKLGK